MADTSMRRGGLGKGLDALMPDALDSGPQPHTVGVDELHRSPQQPRASFPAESMEELARSIRAQGVIEPLIVRPRPGGGFEIIAGERRWRAAQQAGVHELPVVVRDVDDQGAMAIALIENLQREGLRPLEAARAMKRLIDEHSLTHEEVGEALGKSRAQVTNLLRLLNLDNAARERLEAGELEAGHARALLALPSHEQRSAAEQVVARGLSVRQTEALVKRLQASQPTERETPPRDPDVERLERNLGAALGAPVSIDRGRGAGAGRIVISYASLDELEGLLARLGADPQR